MKRVIRVNIRQRLENNEKIILSPLATLSENTRGRLREEEKCSMRTEFQRDRDRIIHSKSFRRLKHKTQVFIAPEGDHYRTRLTHTLEVSQIARTISRSIGLNEDLTEAIALGHDLGHTPFGHTGERALNEVTKSGFKHYEQSLRVVDYLEKGEGLNLTFEVRNGILCHSSDLVAETNEGRVVKLADKIAYINHDIDDALRAGIITFSEIPHECIDVLGKKHSERLNSMISSIVEHAFSFGEIKLTGPIGEATWELRKFMFDRVYIGSGAKTEEDKAMLCIKEIYSYYMNSPGRLPTEFGSRIDKWGMERVVCDYIAGMTDRYAISEYVNIFVPLTWRKIY
jgi:dGTPase